MHIFHDKFDCGGNTRLNQRTGEKYEYFMQENGIQAQPVCIVDYETARVIQNVYDVMSIHFNNDEEKYGLTSEVFKDTNMLRNALKNVNSEEV